MERHAFHDYISSTKWKDREDELFSLFDQRLDVIASMRRHSDMYGDVVNYMVQNIQQYSYNLDETSKRWIPIKFLVYINENDKNYGKRLYRFVEHLSNEHYLTVEEDLLLSLGIPNVGYDFLSWEMTCIFFIQESEEDPSHPTTSSSSNPVIHERLETDDQPEEIDIQVEMQLAKTITMHDDTPLQAEDRLATDAEADFEELKIEELFPVIINDIEYVFLIDIQDVLNLREDEALCALAIVDKIDVLEVVEPQEEPDFVKTTDTETTVAEILQLMKGNEPNIEEADFKTIQKTFIPEDGQGQVGEKVEDRIMAYATHFPDAQGSRPHGYNLSKIDEEDDIDLTNAFEIDKFASRKAGVRSTAIGGRDTSLAEYIGFFRAASIVIFHNKFSPHGKEEMFKCKAFSKSLCRKTLSRTAEKVILIARKLALTVFAGNYTGKVTARAAIASTVDVNEKTIAKEFGGKILGHRRKAKTVQRLSKKHAL